MPSEDTKLTKRAPRAQKPETTQDGAQPLELSIAEKLMINQDLSVLQPPERIEYYKALCSRFGLDALTKPFEYITLQGKLTLYATKSCTDQLRNLNKVSIKILNRENTGGIYIVVAQALTPDGRTDEATGAIALSGLFDKQGNEVAMSPDEIANRIMKAETKAKRRVTLSICGLAMMDEMETETVKTDDQKLTETNAKIVEGEMKRVADAGGDPESAKPAFESPENEPVKPAPEKPKPAKKQAPAPAPEKEPAPLPGAPNEPEWGEDDYEKAKDDGDGAYIIQTVKTKDYLGKRLDELTEEQFAVLFNSWANKPDYIEKFKKPEFADRQAEAEIVRRYGKSEYNLG